MGLVENRDILLVRPKRPFVEWANNYDDKKMPEEVILQSKTMYLVEEIEINDSENIEKLIKKKYQEIFKNELYLWYRDENYFPEKLTYNLF
jgi:hypothetical protein